MLRIKMLAFCLLMNLALPCRTLSPEMWSDLTGLLVAGFWSTKLYIDIYIDKCIRIFIQYIHTYTQNITE
jgi:hypothetical protein